MFDAQLRRLIGHQIRQNCQKPLGAASVDLRLVGFACHQRGGIEPLALIGYVERKPVAMVSLQAA